MAMSRPNDQEGWISAKRKMELLDITGGALLAATTLVGIGAMTMLSWGWVAMVAGDRCRSLGLVAPCLASGASTGERFVAITDRAENKP